MLYIKKGNPPKQLLEFKNKGGKWEAITRDEGKDSLRKSLLEEQNHLCAYCMCRIQFRGSKIDHWFPQSLSIYNLEYKKLDYSNLFLVCGNNHK